MGTIRGANTSRPTPAGSGMDLPPTALTRGTGASVVFGVPGRGAASIEAVDGRRDTADICADGASLLVTLCQCPTRRDRPHVHSIAKVRSLVEEAVREGRPFIFL